MFSLNETLTTCRDVARLVPHGAVGGEAPGARLGGDGIAAVVALKPVLIGERSRQLEVVFVGRVFPPNLTFVS